MLTCLHQLNSKQIRDLEQLIAECRLLDESAPNIYSHLLTQYRALPAACLYYEQEKLTGFISAYFFYEEACEISILVTPSQRRKGIASHLLQAILPLVHSQHLKQLIFSCPHQQNDEWLTSLGFTYQMSEYHMVRQDLHPVLIPNKSLTFHKASRKNLDDLCLIDEACFPKEQTKMLSRFNSLLDDRNYELILAYQDDQPVGKAHIRWHAHGATLSDIGILPNLRGQGLGAALIAYCINQALSEGKAHIDLDVETRNLNALNLYLRLGFIIKNACDYWSLLVAQLQDFPKFSSQQPAG